jgi:hypothetical protein
VEKWDNSTRRVERNSRKQKASHASRSGYYP